MSLSSPGPSESVIHAPCRNRAGIRTMVAICSAVGGAALASMLIVGHSGAPAPASIVPPPTVTVTSSSQVNAVKEMALQSFKQEANIDSAKTFEAGIFIEHDGISSESGAITEINVRSRNGNVRVMHNPEPEVYVLAGKFAVAENTSRAREVAQRLRYDVKRDGEKVTAVIAQPNRFPRGVGGSAICVVVAPANVKVVVSSGGDR